MSYQVLARKWRPRNFSTLVGQLHVVHALTHALTEQRLHHAYLFTGTRGVGKTTIARILAKSLNCERGISATPCGECATCQEIDTGRFIDLIEVDAATNTRVDEMRLLLENAVYAPTRGRFKVYVIDEVHMLSTSAFNAMLKTLEEPPDHVKFILATTDPQKIPVTVLSRCLQFNLKQMPAAAIVGHLSHILDAETIVFEPAALGLIARSASGSMRDALSLLDQAIAHGGGKVLESSVRTMLGTVDRDFLFNVLDALLTGDAAALLGIVSDISIRSLSFSAALQEFGLLLTRLQVLQCVPDLSLEDDPDALYLTRFASAFSPEFIQLAYQIVSIGRSELWLAPDEEAGFTMTLLRLYTFRPADVAEAIQQVVDKKPRALNPVITAEKQPISSSIPPPPPPIITTKSPVLKTSAENLPQPPSAVLQAAPSIDKTRPWSELISDLPLQGLPKQLAQSSELREWKGNTCLLRLPTKQVLLNRPEYTAKIEEALTAKLGHPVRIEMELGEVESATPAHLLDQEKQAALQNASLSMTQDNFVRAAKEHLAAEVLVGSVKPL